MDLSVHPAVKVLEQSNFACSAQFASFTPILNALVLATNFLDAVACVCLLQANAVKNQLA